MAGQPLPPRTILWTLKKFGYTQDQINQHWQAYLEQDPDRAGEGRTNQNTFLHFVRSHTRPKRPASVSQRPPPDWQPAKHLIDQLLAMGVPEAAIAQYREEWLLYAAERGEPVINWDAAFRAFVIQSRQEAADLITVADYLPSKGVHQQLDHQGLTVRECSLLIAEFKLYWNETGSPPRQQAEWDRLFLKHRANALMVN